MNSNKANLLKKIIAEGRGEMDYKEKIKKWNDINIGDTTTFTKTMTETDVTIWVGLTGDLNPVHIDKKYSMSTRFGKCLVPGVLVQGLISTTMTQLTFGNVYANQNIKFIKPVFIGDTVTAIARIIEKIEEKHMVRVETKCINQNDELLMIGEGMEYILP